MDLNRLPVHIKTYSFKVPNGKIYYPQLIGLKNKQAEHRINKAIIEKTNGLIKKHYTFNNPIHYKDPAKSEMQGSYEIKSNERGIVSFVFTNYAYTSKMAHGLMFKDSLTADVDTGHIYPLSEQFAPGSNYVQVISDNIKRQVKERDIPTLGEFKAIQPNQYYYLADKAIVIYFQEYEISPYYVGTPMFPISGYDLVSLAHKDSPLVVMTAQ